MFSKEKNGDCLPHKNLKHSGFPSPANDYIENPINLNELLVKRPSATFLMRFRGHEMIFSGIKNNCILVIDRSIQPGNGDIIVATINDSFLCRKLIIGNKKYLITDCQNNTRIDIDTIIDFELLGVVTSSINTY
ncbi:MAG: LexA family protein [Gammaproteobacteria bacterium]|jgi:DNA polymerase V|tara:strand:- start:419 stop:820 length:402 start_codon:yes stop_codon:yes gene_type:complete